jgi:hypothetical protein
MRMIAKTLITNWLYYPNWIYLTLRDDPGFAELICSMLIDLKEYSQVSFKSMTRLDEVTF